jgi:DNA repair protein RadC
MQLWDRGFYMAITDWPDDQRPRERLLERGAGALSDAELLAIFLRTGVAGMSAVELARELLGQFDHSLSRLAAATPQELIRVKGIGPAKAAQLVATLELARRGLHEEMKSRPALSAPDAVRDWLRLKLAPLPYEVFIALWLDAQNRLIIVDELFRGTLMQTSVYPREVVRQAIGRNAAAVILAHNHPSGCTTPSQADELLTRALKESLALVDVRVLDHFIVAGNALPLSFVEHGLL